MRRRNFLKSIVLTVMAPSLVKGVSKAEKVSVTYSRNVIDLQDFSQDEIKIDCNSRSPVRAVLEESDDIDFVNVSKADPKNLMKRYVRLRYEWPGKVGVCKTVIYPENEETFIFMD